MWLRMKHFMYAIPCGVFLTNWFICVLAAGMEFKDNVYSSKCDWLDILATLLGGLYATGLISLAI